MKKYTKDHEWVELDGETATLGISEHAAGELGDITFVELPEKGAVLGQGDVVSVVESVKAASDVYSPVGGTVTEVNTELSSNPAVVNESAEDNGWICKLKILDAKELDSLMDEAGYTKYLASL